MSIREFIQERRIEEIVHFTTNRGLLGILATGCVKSRARLTKDDYLEHILKLNCADRSRDAAWLDYVNLSFGRINSRLFGISSNKWHSGFDGFWCILSFSPEILEHSDVYFSTTNNMYSGVRRAEGLAGLRALYTDKVHQYASNYAKRDANTPRQMPTCPQAEVLYPGELSTAYLQRVYVREVENVDTVIGMCGALGISPVSCVVDASRFT